MNPRAWLYLCLALACGVIAPWWHVAAFMGCFYFGVFVEIVL